MHKDANMYKTAEESNKMARGIYSCYRYTISRSSITNSKQMQIHSPKKNKCIYVSFIPIPSHAWKYPIFVQITENRIEWWYATLRIQFMDRREVEFLCLES